MKLTSDPTYLRLILYTLESRIIPDLKSESVRSDAGFAASMVRELLRRGQSYPDTLSAVNAEGLSIVSELQASLGRRLPDEDGDPGNPLEIFGQISEVMAALAKDLSQSNVADPLRSRLLFLAGEWELNSHKHLLGLPSPAASEIARSDEDPLPREVLQKFFEDKHPDGRKVQIAAFERIPGGFGKQTWAVELRDASSRPTQLIVRKSGRVVINSHKAFDLEREFNLLTAINRLGTTIPLPKPLWMGGNVIGADAPFYVMERLPGKSPGSFMGGAAKLPESFVLEWAEVLAHLHAIKPESMSDYLHQYDGTELLTETVEQTYRRYVADWRTYAESIKHLPSPVLEYLFDWLGRNIPADSNQPVMVHGDFGVHNMLADNGHVSGLVDWELACFGSPVMDLAYVKPVVEKHMNWSRFIQHYTDVSGNDLDLSAIPFYDAYLAMRGLISLNMGTKLLQDGKITEPNIAMFELGITSHFMQMGMNSARGTRGFC